MGYDIRILNGPIGPTQTQKTISGPSDTKLVELWEY
jgi:hypothetical protein